MKKRILSLMVVIAMLCSIVTCIVQADTVGEGDYFYFDVEHVSSDETREIYMTPIKIYTNGFYDYSGEFETFDNEFESAAEAIGYILDYYMNNGKPMSDLNSETILIEYSNSSGFFSAFNINNSEFDYPTTSYNNAMSDGLGSYTYDSGTLNKGDVIRMIFNEAEWNPVSPAEDLLVGAVADYYEKLAIDSKTAKNAEQEYQTALENFFDEDLQNELKDNLIKALTLKVEPTLIPTIEPTVTPTASPTAAPTAIPTASSTAIPTFTPTASPTAAPTATPTASPTATPTASPTAIPTLTPTVSPTATPTSTILPVQSKAEQSTLKIENGKLKGNLTVKLNNNFTEEKTASVMAVIYDSKGKLIGMQPKEITLKPDEENQVEFKEMSADSDTEYIIKVLTWGGNISSLAPISNTLDLNIK